MTRQLQSSLADRMGSTRLGRHIGRADPALRAEGRNGGRDDDATGSPTFHVECRTLYGGKYGTEIDGDHAVPIFIGNRVHFAIGIDRTVEAFEAQLAADASVTESNVEAAKILDH